MAFPANPPLPAPRDQPLPWPVWGEPAGWAGVILLALHFLRVSWLKWPDPQVDFGAQLYIPWRLSESAVLYRDVSQNYGPLSQYFNAALFRIFGPGLTVLVTANLVFCAAILGTLGGIIRRAWGPGAALLAAGLFVSVFAFSQYVGIGNYNYVTPYAHECTHGILVCLLLVVCLSRWLENPTRAGSLLAGFLLGLTAVLKPEFMLAGGLVTLTAIVLAGKSGRGKNGVWLAYGGLGALLPTLLFVLWFARPLSLKEAWLAATNAWSVLLTSPEIAANPMQSAFLGTDQPWPSLAAHLTATAYALLIVAGIAGAALIVQRTRRPQTGYAVLAVSTGLLAWLSLTGIDWLACGRCLFGLAAIYLGTKATAAWRTGLPHDRRARLRLLFAVLALGLMARMVLNGRIQHFGFYQAMPAALLIPAVLLGELPERFRTGWARAVCVCGTLALVLPGAAQFAAQSGRYFALKTEPVGTGRDRFYAAAPPVSSTGRLVAAISGFLGDQPAGSVLVLPEGLMINYLARKVSPVPPLFFYFNATADGREARLVEQLERQPPEWVVLLSRDLRTAGIQRYGEKSGSGQELLAWVAGHYAMNLTIGGDPRTLGQQGLILYRRK